MDQETRELLIEILSGVQVATLAVLVDEVPYTGLLPFAARPDFQAILIHASDLARHTRGLQPGAPYSLLIYAPLQADQDPLQTPRISLQGLVERLGRDTPAYAEARKIFIAKYPQSAMIFSFQDFNLYELLINRGQFVAGFAKAYPLTPKRLAGLGQSPEEN